MNEPFWSLDLGWVWGLVAQGDTDEAHGRGGVTQSATRLIGSRVRESTPLMQVAGINILPELSPYKWRSLCSRSGPGGGSDNWANCILVNYKL